MKIDRPPSKQPIPSHARPVFTGKIFNVFQWEQPLFDGSVGTFEKITRTDTVNVIPITAEGKIILSEQQQPGIDPFIGVIGGRLDPGEDPLTAIKRELLEETGLIADEWVLWDTVQLTEKIDWAIYTFVAKGCHRQTAGHLDAGEKINLIELTFEEFIHATAQPNFRDIEISLKLFRTLGNPFELERMQKLFKS